MNKLLSSKESFGFYKETVKNSCTTTYANSPE